MEHFKQPSDKSLHVCFMLCIIFETSGFYGAYSLI